MEKEGEIVIYQAPDNPNQVEVRIERNTVWLTQKQMAELFDTTPQNITIHLKNIIDEAELDENSTCKDFLQVQMEGKRRVERKQRFYNLDAILSVGYRISSKRGTQFRIWATQRLKEYLIRGYSVNENRLIKNSQHLGRLKDLIETIEEAQKEGRLKIEDSDILMKLISEYSKSFTLFNEIDSDSMTREGLNTNIIYEINYDDVMQVVARFKSEIERRGETNNIFGLELEDRVKSSIN
jgi:hypothetical protein